MEEVQGSKFKVQSSMFPARRDLKFKVSKIAF